MPDLDPGSNNLDAWEAHYEAGLTPWDHAAAHPMIPILVEEACLHGRILVPGCGAGHDVEGLSACGLDALGIDLAPSAITKAEKLYPGSAFEQQDLFKLPDAFAGTMAELLVALETCSEASISGTDNLQTMALVDAAYQSAKEKRAVSLNEIMK